MMGRFGHVIGLPFAIEAIAFFVEAIFLGIYLYGWDRLPPRRHFLAGIPIAIAGAASAWFVVAANTWMNQPRGFRLAGDAVVDVDPWRAMLNPATGPQTTHMLVAAGMVSGFAVASVYAFAWLRGRRDRYHRIAFTLPFAVAAVLAPLQVVVGDWAVRFIADKQPVKLAAAEALIHTERGAPLSFYAIRIPNGLSLLLHGDADAEVSRPRPGAARRPASSHSRPFGVRHDGGHRVRSGRARHLGWRGLGSTTRVAPLSLVLPGRVPGRTCRGGRARMWVGGHRGGTTTLDRVSDPSRVPTPSAPRPTCAWGTSPCLSCTPC